MKKKMLIGVLVVVIVTTVIGLAAGLITYHKVSMAKSGHRDGKDLIPIEMITGIYCPAALKPGCTVKNGYDFPYSDDGPWCAAMVTNEVINLVRAQSDENYIPKDGLTIESLSIIDVYGDKCTIVFTCEEGNGQYAAYDYPLDNLIYDPIKVAQADDGVQSKLYGSGFTLIGSRINYIVDIILRVILFSAILSGGILLIIRKCSNKRKGEEV